ncbi:HNH endonuclease [Dongia deserti]|uniref:HNH endonuclease n=1 Tax=Dongia deserti TaxID=2268030 RepID=UPI00254759AA|nr:HNH endonuclease signature motif containing protein [Dongia deserti]
MRANPVLVELWRFQGHRCAYCGRMMPDPRAAIGPADPTLKPTIDHVTPLSAGGRDVDGNRVAACIGCNVLKGPLDVQTFIRLRWNKMLLNDAKNRIRLSQESAAANARGDGRPARTADARR